uniref:Large ribosomal subunit protein bL28m n=1 Tax=Attheya septentrionalis TaxID=420275 RepID=A0A7S2UR07_9STRA|mmetsp:Transcript_8790/g.15944  ORF Transcript_8790/g.15944 Transcript_8790/m.15944 type:complete len:214 (+) Transcript_8790:132-773(+)
MLSGSLCRSGTANMAAISRRSATEWVVRQGSAANATRGVTTLASCANPSFTAPSVASINGLSGVENRGMCALDGVQAYQQQQQQVRYRSNRSRRGIYDGKDIRAGNNVSFSMKATKRKFKPNVFVKRVYSEVLDEMVRFHLTTSALRSIDKAGGLDNYILTSRHVTEGEGKAMKIRILDKMARDLEKKDESIETATVEETPAAPVDNKDSVSI